MILFKSCPKCKGDLFSDPYEDSDEFECLQCGRSVTVNPVKEHHWQSVDSLPPIEVIQDMPLLEA